MRELGASIRAGLHTGECELLPGEDVGGIAVHIAARIAALAGPGEVLASSTVRDLSVGSPFTLESRGEQRLKGVADPWRRVRRSSVITYARMANVTKSKTAEPAPTGARPAAPPMRPCWMSGASTRPPSARA